MVPSEVFSTTKMAWLALGPEMTKGPRSSLAWQGSWHTKRLPPALSGTRGLVSKRTDNGSPGRHGGLNTQMTAFWMVSQLLPGGPLWVRLAAESIAGISSRRPENASPAVEVLLRLATMPF